MIVIEGKLVNEGRKQIAEKGEVSGDYYIAAKNRKTQYYYYYYYLYYFALCLI